MDRGGGGLRPRSGSQRLHRQPQSRSGAAGPRVALRPVSFLPVSCALISIRYVSPSRARVQRVDFAHPRVHPRPALLLPLRHAFFFYTSTRLTQVVERYMLMAQVILISLMLVSSAVIVTRVTGSSFAGIFPAWPLLNLSLFATILATCLYAESFFTGEYYVVALGARFLGVQTLGLVMLWAWLLPATSKWLRCCRRKKLSEAILADDALQPSQRAHLQRQLQLQVHGLSHGREA